MSESIFLSFVILITSFSGIAILFMAFLLIRLKRRQRLRNKKQLQQLLHEKENAMHIIAMELHDNVNQVLYMLRTDLHVVEENVPAACRSLVRAMEERLDQLLFDTQNISHYLNPQYIKNIGFIAALKGAVTWLNATGRIRCSLNIEGERKALPDRVGLMTFRIAQEAIRNVLKYAEADWLSIRLTFRGRDFRMQLKDNGKGIAAKDLHKGSGIANLRQRARIIGGMLTINSFGVAAGTTVLLEIPNVI